MKQNKRSVTLCMAVLLSLTMLFMIPQVIKGQEITDIENLEFAGKGTSTVTIPDEWTWGAVLDKGEISYLDSFIGIHFEPEVTGYVELNFIANSPKMEDEELWYEPKGSVELRKENAKGKVIGEDSYNIDSKNGSDKLCFGVKKGKTYCFVVQADCGVNITATVHDVKKSAASKKEKAKTLKRGKEVEGIIIAGEKRADWYKLKVTGQKQIKLSYTTKATDADDYSGIKVTFCKQNGKKFSTYSTDWISGASPNGWMKVYRQNKAGKKKGVTAGTYYIKVEPYNECSSGYYTLKWK